MTFTINSVTRCAGLNHWTVTLTFGGGQQRSIDTDLAEFQEDQPENQMQARQAIIARVRSAVKEANATTFAAAKTALEGKTFKV